MFNEPLIRVRTWPLAAVLLLLTIAGAAALSAGGASASPAAGLSSSTAAQSCTQLEDFDADGFPRRPEIDNRYLPMVPGTRTILEGEVDGVPHRVEFTVTDLTKVVDDVRVLVIWDTDTSEGQLEESELSFFAQDEDGNVWNLGEYPEEYDGHRFAGAPSTWISGEEGAEAGIHMQARPLVRPRQYVQGFAPAIDFLDCAQVVEKGQETCVEAGCFDNVLVTHETNLLVPEDGIQSKYHAPGLGIIRIGTVDPPTGEILELVAVEHLDRNELGEARNHALRLDRRGYRVSEAYGSTSPATRLDPR